MRAGVSLGIWCWIPSLDTLLFCIHRDELLTLLEPSLVQSPVLDEVVLACIKRVTGLDMMKFPTNNVVEGLVRFRMAEDWQAQKCST